MKKASYAALVLALLLGSFFAGSWYTRRDTATNSQSPALQILYYVDPMHPAYKSDKPGVAPDCGMELVPVYADGSMGGQGRNTPGQAGTVSVRLDTQQLIGVRLATAQMTTGSHALRVLGRVAPDETRIYRINAATDGWVKKILPVTTDSLVQKDELLATFYAPEFASAMKAYLFGLRALDRADASRKENREQGELMTSSSIDNYRNALRNLGMTDHQLDEIQRTRQGGEHVEIRAPEAGFILTRNLTLGERFQRGNELFRIADLSRVWIVVDTYGTEGASLRPGTQVRVSAPHLGKTFTAKVAHVPPSFDPAARTRRVRLEMENPGSILRPDMFVDVELPIALSPAVAVPVDAIVESGTKKTVYVAKGDGVFEPRRVETGWRAGDQVEIIKGLMEGERIVVSGTFLIDSESRMKAAAAGIYGETSECPVCGMEVNIAKAKAVGLTSEFQGQTYYFCAAEDKTKFDAQPTKYTMKSSPSPTSAAGKRMEQIEGHGAKAHEPKDH